MAMISENFTPPKVTKSSKYDSMVDGFAIKVRKYRRHGAMLEMKSNCEKCEVSLPKDTEDAMICSFECTFCTRCTNEILKGTCPNCGGELVRRPTRISK